MQKITRIQSAVRQCLMTLPPSCSPQAHLENHLAQLRADESWTDDDTNEVASRVRRVFATFEDNNPRGDMIGGLETRKPVPELVEPIELLVIAYRAKRRAVVADLMETGS